ncbi:Uncharacterised protein [Vibrio cholerae]|nr:Uncharacterised protein [Vibrio cholerae]
MLKSFFSSIKREASRKRKIPTTSSILSRYSTTRPCGEWTN